MSRLSQSARQSSMVLLSAARSFCQSSSDSHSISLLMITGVSPGCRFWPVRRDPYSRARRKPSEAFGGARRCRTACRAARCRGRCGPPLSHSVWVIDRKAPLP